MVLYLPSREQAAREAAQRLLSLAFQELWSEAVRRGFLSLPLRGIVRVPVTLYPERKLICPPESQYIT